MKAFGFARDVVPGPQRRPQAGAVIGGRGLQIGRAKRGLTQQSGIGDAVEGAAASHGNGVAGHQAMQPTETMHRGIFKPHLDRARDIPFTLRDHPARCGRTEFRDQLVGIEPAHYDVPVFARGAAFAAAVHAEIALGQLEPTVIRQHHQLTHHVGEAVFAIGREAHDLVFLAERIEADVLAQGGVKEPEAVGQGHPVEHLDTVAFATRGHHGHEIARRIVREPGGHALERRTIIRRCDVRQMVFDGNGLEPDPGRIFVADGGEPIQHRQRFTRTPPVGQPGLQPAARIAGNVIELGPAIGPRVAGNRHKIDIREA